MTLCRSTSDTIARQNAGILKWSRDGPDSGPQRSHRERTEARNVVMWVGVAPGGRMLGRKCGDVERSDITENGDRQGVW